MSSDTSTINTPEPQRNRKATDDLAFLHDAHAHCDLKMIRFRQQAGWEGYGLFWMLIEHMRLQKDLALSWCDIETLSHAYGLEPLRLNALVKVAIEIGLFDTDEEKVWSESLIRRVEAWNGKSVVRSNAGRKGGLATQEKKRKESCASSKEESKPEVLLEANENFASSKRNITQSNIIESNVIESKEATAVDPPPELADFWDDAVRALVADNHPALLESGVFSSTGRRPMVKYPELWISPVELAEVFKLYQDSGIPPDKYGLAFKPVVARLRTHKANGSRTDKVAAVNWLTSWALDQALTTLKKSKDLERSETYLEQSQRQR